MFSQHTPVAVVGLKDIAELAAGRDHTCVRTRDGAAACWGANAGGQLGDATTTPRTRPTAVARLAGAVDLALGTAHSCALLNTGNVTCWGSDAHRALGPRRL